MNVRELELEDLRSVSGGIVADMASGDAHKAIPLVGVAIFGGAGGLGAYLAGSSNPNICGAIAGTISGIASTVVGTATLAGGTAVGVFGSWLTSNAENVCNGSRGGNLATGAGGLFEAYGGTYLERNEGLELARW
jgi:hypothetical protein